MKRTFTVWCKHIVWDKKMGEWYTIWVAHYGKGEWTHEWEEKLTTPNTWKFCPVCGKPRPVEKVRVTISTEGGREVR